MTGEISVPENSGDHPTPAHQRPLADLRSQLTQLPVDKQQQVLKAYQEQRANFRSWLLEQLREGVHYGYPPGTLPQTKLVNGVTYFAQKTRNGISWIPETQWSPKPSLYKAGADFIIELFACRDSYEADASVWQMMGSKPNEICMRCDLHDRVSGEKIADGHGFASRGDKADWDGTKGNTAVKMASKRAKVAAVLNGFGLADLFTQDTEDSGETLESRPEVANPQQSAEAPREVAPREDGSQSPGPAKVGSPTVDELRKVYSRWSRIVKAECEQLGEPVDTGKEAFRHWLSRVTGLPNSEELLTGEGITRQHLRALEKDCAASEEGLGL